MKVEAWQNVNGKLIIDDDKAIAVKDEKALLNHEELKKMLKEKGKPVNDVRQALIKNTVKQQIKIDPLEISKSFNENNDSVNAEKTKKLINSKPVHQYKQVKNELQFFGESFLEGFLGFYGLKIDNALSRYEQNLKVVEKYDLGKENEKQYFIGRAPEGKLELASKVLPTREIAESELAKFYGQTAKQEETQTAKIQRERKDNNE
ncbi:hypothetical protein FC89_GL000220 [Liquorilactobacillus ghanensis DSM 18630]|uniref:Uncharacterized protein n=1 Tax=Liquorilactobacillus ghanensis DSM 18630 TaxID=1423750 RepID=A0A0R1VQ27_9LACO|nr:hypothetical protein [Liquorilactobacillus ghanensis]KRM07533.1 hypothetical protein FC89_GL000220 [Liquorilactobacillus ghanensis DSM 18630]